MSDTLIEYLYEIMENYSEQAWEYGALKKAIEALKPVEDVKVEMLLYELIAIAEIHELPGYVYDVCAKSINYIERLVREKADRPYTDAMYKELCKRHGELARDVKELTDMAEGYKRASHINESAKLKLRAKVAKLEDEIRYRDGMKALENQTKQESE